MAKVFWGSIVEARYSFLIDETLFLVVAWGITTLKFLVTLFNVTTYKVRHVRFYEDALSIRRTTKKGYFLVKIYSKLTFIWLARLSFLRFRGTGLLFEVRNFGSTTYCFWGCGMYSCLISSMLDSDRLAALLVHTEINIRVLVELHFPFITEKNRQVW